MSSRRWPMPGMVGPVPYCNCFRPNVEAIPLCFCGEELNIREWTWERPEGPSSWVRMSRDNHQVTFHPFYSSGTAVARGDTCFNREFVYYWEVKVLTEPYGTDVMIGVGSQNVDVYDSVFHFRSFLGRDVESYGLSYTGAVCHAAEVIHDSLGFGRGSIVGVKVDMWLGTLEFFLNREGLGVSFTELRKHLVLYPMICSTAAQSVMRLTYSSSWKASLLVAAGKVLANSVRREAYFRMLPPGLCSFLMENFFITLPSTLDETKHASPPFLHRQPMFVRRRHWNRMW